jgi:hypothetical protein
MVRWCDRATVKSQPRSEALPSGVRLGRQGEVIIGPRLVPLGAQDSGEAFAELLRLALAPWPGVAPSLGTGDRTGGPKKCTGGSSTRRHRPPGTARRSVSTYRGLLGARMLRGRTVHPAARPLRNGIPLRRSAAASEGCASGRGRFPLTFHSELAPCGMGWPGMLFESVSTTLTISSSEAPSRFILPARLASCVQTSQWAAWSLV